MTNNFGDKWLTSQIPEATETEEQRVAKIRSLAANDPRSLGRLEEEAIAFGWSSADFAALALREVCR